MLIFTYPQGLHKRNLIWPNNVKSSSDMYQAWTCYIRSIMKRGTSVIDFQYQLVQENFLSCLSKPSQIKVFPSKPWHRPSLLCTRKHSCGICIISMRSVLEKQTMFLLLFWVILSAHFTTVLIIPYNNFVILKNKARTQMLVSVNQWNN